MENIRVKTGLALRWITSWTSWFTWIPTSDSNLEIAQNKILSYLKKPHQQQFLDIGPGYGLESNKILTLTMQPDDEEDKITGTPLVMIHGFASGVGLWLLNLDSLASQDRKVYAFDVLGFGRSSRPYFDKRGEEAEWQLVESIERWRTKAGLNDKFILLGHSFGAYLALAYALHFPNRVSHLILADPWGIPAYETPEQSRTTAQYHLPLWVKVIGTIVFQVFSPLALLRFSGPWGPKLVETLRSDIRKKYEHVIKQSDADIILNYVYHCNAQTRASGELAFKSLVLPHGWAKYPMMKRIHELQDHINITFIYGSRSWIDRQPAFQIKRSLGDERVDIQVIQGAGHHVYADKAEEFNALINSICQSHDERVKLNLEERNNTHHILSD